MEDTYRTTKTDPEPERREGREEVLAPGVSRAERLPVRHPRPVRGWRERFRGAPFLQLILYYVALVAAVALLSDRFPLIHEALFEPVSLPAVSEGRALLTGDAAATPAAAEPESLAQIRDRGLTTLLVILGALALVVPVARVYMQTKRLRYDPALVSSVIILPIVVAGIALVVKDSVALAFSLAGIVAAVRFRNTLKDPRDAVYIFLVIGIGLSAGVQVLDVALVMSAIFNFVVLGLWKYNVGSIYGGRFGQTGVVSSGDSALMVADDPRRRRQLRRALLEDAEDLETDGVLLVHSPAPEMARHTVQEALSEMAKDWKLAKILPRDGGMHTLEYLIRLKKKSTPAELVGALTERWSEQVAATEYFWFRTREHDRDEDDDE